MAPDLQTRLTQGMTFAQLLERSRHASLLLAFLEAAPPKPLPEEVAWVLALVEDWCPREAYRLGEKRIVPTLVFLDRELKELARWHGPPEEARAFFRARLAEGAPASQKEKRALLAAYHRAFPQMAKAIREEWARLLRRASGPPG